MEPRTPIRCLVTAGPTREYIDPFRYISNPSSGRMGYAVARAAAARGWSVDLVAGPVSLPEPDNVILYPVETGEEMLHQVDALFDPCDVLIMVAAVCDFRPRERSAHKLKKEESTRLLELEPVTDILATMAARRREDQILVGFAAETRDLEAYARRKLEAKHLDLIAANLIGAADGGFGDEANTLHLFGRDGSRETLGPAPKAELGEALVSRINDLLPGPAFTPA